MAATPADPNNRIPERVAHIHLIAVCGTGMGALACMLKDLGYTVTGSDQNIYPPMSDFLAGKGIPVAAGYHPDNLNRRPDLVVVGNAVSRTNPEVERMLSTGVCYCSMPQAFNHFVAAGKKAVVVTGTHGKTTTTALAAWILTCAGLDPTFLIGGILKNFDSNYRLGQGDVVVVEGDEYDTAFFDKGSKFLHYRPHVAVLTSVEFDHADIFEDLAHVRRVFETFVGGLPADAVLIAFDEDPIVASLLNRAGCRVETYGRAAGVQWQLDATRIESPRTFFSVRHGGQPFGEFATRLPGEHNLFNTLAAVAAARHLGVDATVIAEALASFESVRRRQEIRGVKNGITVMDDFAHHPTAVRETVRAVKAHCRSGRLIAVFEPRTNTSMRDVFQSVYPEAFGGADLVCVRRPPLLSKIPADRRFSSEKLVADLVGRGQAAHYFENTDAIIAFLAGEARSGDLILVMSNGGFDNIHARLLKIL
jgi:UDP-N-acetylmuramate: L-alanyl-gamma-D-glutamyl-meso-diaminopimelate ligase